MSKSLIINIPHQLGALEAKRRLEGGLASLGQQVPGGLSDFRQRWDGDRLTFSASAVGQTISGAADVMADQVRLEILLPGLLGLMAGKLRGKIEQQGQLLLEQKRP
jgi:hypothetical protein